MGASWFEKGGVCFLPVSYLIKSKVRFLLSIVRSEDKERSTSSIVMSRLLCLWWHRRRWWLSPSLVGVTVADHEWAQEGALGERAAPPGDRWRQGEGEKICHGAA